MQLQTIQKKIHIIRGEKVILDYHLAELYDVETKALKQAVPISGRFYVRIDKRRI